MWIHSRIITLKSYYLELFMWIFMDGYLLIVIVMIMKMIIEWFTIQYLLMKNNFWGVTHKCTYIFNK